MAVPPPDEKPRPDPEGDRTRPARPRTAGPAAGDDGPALPLRSTDETDTGWGDWPDSSEDRLREDRPPHWDAR